MPQALPAIGAILSAAGGAVSAGFGAVSAFAATGIGGFLLKVGLAFGISFLAQALFRPKGPSPEDVQTEIRESVRPRVRHYGRVKASGVVVFIGTRASRLHKVLAIGSGEIDGVEEIWQDDNYMGGTLRAWVAPKRPPLLESGAEFEAPYTKARTWVDVRLGTASQTAFSGVVAGFSTWTADHRGNGVAAAHVVLNDPPSDELSRVFPNVARTNFSFVLRGAKLFDPRDNGTRWDDNAAMVVRDYLTHPDGMRMPSTLFETPLAVAGWQNAARRCDDQMPTPDGTESRYRLWGSYTMDERPADVLQRMQAGCDGRLIPTADGGLTLDVGSWRAPTVTLDENTITGFVSLRRGRDVRTSANVVKASFLNPAANYATDEADPWINQTSVAERGEIPADTSFIMAPSHSQARRLMKQFAARANPDWVGTFALDLGGLACIGERFVRIDYTMPGGVRVNGTFEIQDLDLDITPEGVLRGCTIDVVALDAEAFAFSAAECGQAPVATLTFGAAAVPRANTPDAVVVDDNGTLSIVVTITDAASSQLSTELEQFDGAWKALPYDPDTLSASVPATAGEVCQFRARLIGFDGKAGPYSATRTITA